MLQEEALEIIERLLPPGALTSIRVLIFQESWLGKEYATIAKEAGYDYSYVRESGAQLWRLLSEALSEPIKKKNFRSVLQQRFSERACSWERVTADPLPATEPLDSPESLEFPGSAVPLYSRFYIERPTLEARCYAEISKPGGLLRVQAPRKMGKSSLLLRIVHHAARLNYRTVNLDLKQADAEIFADLNRFLRWFCTSVSHQLGVQPRLHDYWDDQVGSKASCTLYLSRYLLPQSDAPLLLCLNEFDRVLDYPLLAQDVLPLLQSWYEAAKQNRILQKLRLVLAYARDICVPFLGQPSLDDVGLPIELPELTATQVQTLAQQYGLPWINASPVRQLMAMVGGHPYLVQLALYHLGNKDVTLGQLLRDAATPFGIYGHHLQSGLSLLHAHPGLKLAFQQILAAHTTVLDPSLSCRLQSLGLVTLEGRTLRPRCELYRFYFSAQLPVDSISHLA